jgi:hypothetical protein
LQHLTSFKALPEVPVLHRSDLSSQIKLDLESSILPADRSDVDGTAANDWYISDTKDMSSSGEAMPLSITYPKFSITEFESEKAQEQML